MKLHKALVKTGFHMNCENFMKAYSEAHEKYQAIRYQQLVEVTNAVWISEALNSLGFKTTPENPEIKKAVDLFFEDYLNSLSLRPCTLQLLKKTSANYKLGLISNFTYAPVIRAALRKLGINQFFNAVLISEEVCWRKPHPKIFEKALSRLGASPMETVYVGDSPKEDIKGAKALGMKTVFVPSQFYSLEDLHGSQQKPDLIAEDVCMLYKNFDIFLKELSE